MMPNPTRLRIAHGLQQLFERLRMAVDVADEVVHGGVVGFTL